MTLTDIFDADGDGSEDDGSLYSLSVEFLEAARLLHATPPTRINYSLVIYYLLGHSAELLLKAFLYRRNVSIPQLKKAGHNLERLVGMAKENGLPNTLSLPGISQLATAYGRKELEYRTHSRKTFPNLDLLIEEIVYLSSVVFDTISQ